MGVLRSLERKLCRPFQGSWQSSPYTYGWKPWAMISRPLRGGTRAEQTHVVAVLGLDPNSQRRNAAAAA